MWRSPRLSAWILPLALAACVALALLAPRPARGNEPPSFATTVIPLGMILNELTSGCARVHVLLAPGASPHTYEPRPSDAARVEQALALFYVDLTLDGWAARLPARRRVAVFELLPAAERLVTGDIEQAGDGHDHSHDHDHAPGAPDPHFWSDPLAVRTLLEPLAAQLAALDPPRAAQYHANAVAAASRMTALDADLRETLAPVHGRGVILFHPSLAYMLRRYQLPLLGVIVAAPGKEPSPRDLQQIGTLAQRSGARALFTEPQLPRRPAEIIAENTGLRLFELDPNGGVDGRRTLEQLLRFNADVLREALQ